MSAPESFMAGTSSSPDRRAVNDFHRNADNDARAESLHHTLGNGANQAAYGNHIHDGQRGLAILSGVTFTGSRTNNVSQILNDICNALVLVGAVNNTSA